MPKYLISLYRPNAFDHNSSNLVGMRNNIDALNEKMVAAGIRIFVGGLQPTKTTKSLKYTDQGKLEESDHPHLTNQEYVDGFWVIQCANIDDAMEWGRLAAIACMGSVDVRPFY